MKRNRNLTALVEWLAPQWWRVKKWRALAMKGTLQLSQSPVQKAPISNGLSKASANPGEPATQPDEATALCHLCLLFPGQRDTTESSAPRVLRRELQAIRKCSKIKRHKAGQGTPSSSNTETVTKPILRFAHTRGSRKEGEDFLGVSSTLPHR